MQFFAWNGDILAKIVKKPNAEWVLRLYQRVEGPKEEHLKVLSHHLRHLLLPEFPELEIAKQSSLGFGLLSQVTSKFHNP